MDAKINELVEQLKLEIDSEPLRERFTFLLKKINLFVEEEIQKKDLAENLLRLAQQEMQSTWELIQQRDALTRAILNASQDIILTLNENGCVIEFNHATESLLGLPAKEIIGQNILTLVSGGSILDDLQRYFKNNSVALKMEKFLGQIYERTLVTNAGKKIHISVYPNKVQAGSVYIYPLYIRDLTIALENERLLNEARSQFLMVSKLSALGEMAGGVAHEINTPLAIIQMRADQLLDHLSEPNLDRALFAKALEAIDVTVKRISKIVNGLRCFARDGSKDPVSLNSLNQIIDDVFSLCREKFNNHGVKLDYVVAKDIQFECRASEIAQVVLNLLNNAYDAVQDCEEKWVRIEAKELDSQIQISVTDSGKGIPDEIKERIMQPFFTTKEIGKGTGLGLSISNGIIEAHEGKISIDNKASNTTFKILMPLSAVNIAKA